MIGSRIGVYEVLAKLGEGGMGEVYRARDPQLRRDVAIKVVSQSFGGDPERLARFEREAHVLAALNHPHIAQIYGLETGAADADPAQRAIVMELVEGETLADKLGGPAPRGALPVNEALEIARQIADALDAAHERGIIHRDLKPANIKVTPDGVVKVLDFGLAKALDTADVDRQTADGIANSPTITSPAVTMHGVILGTAAYMAPEQAKGKAVDKRVDIWAFGCVLYEMLTGRRPFAGDDVTDTLAFVLTKDVDWGALPAQTPVPIQMLLRQCLEKNPKQRLRDIGDAHLLLRSADTVPPRRVTKSSTMAWVIAATSAAATIATIAVLAWNRPAVSAAQITRFVVPPPVAGMAVTDPLLSPDGSFLVFKGDQLYVRKLSEFESRPIRGTQNARMPFLSPDGRSVGFFADGKLKKVSIDGGDPLVICDAEADSPGAAWGLDNRIFFTKTWIGASLMAVSADGGTVAPVSTLDTSRRERGHWWPQPLGDGRHVLFTIYYAGAGIAESQIGVLDLTTGQHRALFPGAYAQFAAGHLVYLHAGVYKAVRFDPAALAVTSEPRVVLDDAYGIPATASASKPLGLSRSGTIAYQFGDLYLEKAATWIHRDGRREDASFKLRHVGRWLSPDGTKLAFGRPQGGTSQIVVYDLARRSEQRLQAEGFNHSPVWHPDGRRLGFVSMRNGDFDAYVQDIDGSPAQPLLATDSDETPVGWMPDGQRVVIKEGQPDGSQSYSLIDLTTKARSPLVTGPYLKLDDSLSPDGRWLAFSANPSGKWQLYVRRVSTEGGVQPVAAGIAQDDGVYWSPAASELLFLRGLDLVALRYDGAGDRFVVKDEHVIARLAPGPTIYGISPDGRRVLVGEMVNPAAAGYGIRVVVNGLETLTKTSAQ